MERYGELIAGGQSVPGRGPSAAGNMACDLGYRQTSIFWEARNPVAEGFEPVFQRRMIDAEKERAERAIPRPPTRLAHVSDHSGKGLHVHRRTPSHGYATFEHVSNLSGDAC